MALTRRSVMVFAPLLSLSATAQTSSGSALRQTGIRRIEVSAEPSGEVFEVRISPGVATVFVFGDAELVRDAEGGVVVDLERRASFTRVEGADTMLQLVPSDELMAGDSLRLVVRFKGGAAPARAVFTLVVHPVLAERLVEVYRGARTMESYQQELLGAREEVQRCHEHLAQVRAEHGGPGGLTGLLALGLVDLMGVAGRSLARSASEARSASWNVQHIRSYRAIRRLAVQVFIDKEGPESGAPPWVPEGATLTNRRGEQLRVLSIWQNGTSESASDIWTVIVEAEAPVPWRAETWTLRFWESATGRAATFGNITFQ